jgi:hypothetical protein
MDVALFVISATLLLFGWEEAVNDGALGLVIAGALVAIAAAIWHMGDSIAAAMRARTDEEEKHRQGSAEEESQRMGLSRRG